MADEKSKSLTVERKTLGKDDLSYIGHGYDMVNGPIYDGAFQKGKIFEPEVVFFEPIVEEYGDTKVATNEEDISKGITASVGFNIDLGKFIPFSMDIKAKYHRNDDHHELHRYAYLYHNYIKGTEVFDNCDVTSIKKLLTPSFKEAIANPNVTPAQLVDSFGTHVIASGVKHGARFSVYLSFDDVNNKFNSEFNADLVSKIMKAKTDAHANLTDDEKALSSTLNIEVNQIGGQLSKGIFDDTPVSEKFDYWHASLEKDGNGEALVSIAQLHGIWELVDDENRANEIKQYIYNKTVEMRLNDKKKILALAFMNKPKDKGAYGLDYGGACGVVKGKFQKAFANDPALQDFDVEVMYDYRVGDFYHVTVESEYNNEEPTGDMFCNRPEFVFVAYVNEKEGLSTAFMPRVYNFTLEESEEEACKLHSHPCRPGWDPNHGGIFC
jgi:hypothetical protein